MCTRNAYRKVVEDFAAGDPFLMAESSGALFKDNAFYLDYCHAGIKVSYPEGKVEWIEGGKNELDVLSHDEKIVILQYLRGASGLPSRGKWLSFLELRGGQLHWLTFQKEALEPLARAYGRHKEEFMARGKKFGGVFFGQGDAGITIPVFPKIPLTFILWEGGGEFPPRSVILFDSISETYLSTATLYVMAIQVLIRIWFPGDTRFAS